VPTPIPTLVAVLVLCGSVSVASAQSIAVQQPVSVIVRASNANGSIHGVVRDEVGQHVAGVSVIAMGTTLMAAETDLMGRFRLALPPGEYVLRAIRDGYVSTFREPVRVFSSMLIEKDIMLVRDPLAPGGQATGSGEQLIAGVAPGGHAHTELAWRLRHLRRNVLRDEAPGGLTGTSGDTPDLAESGSGLFDRALYGSARAATAFFRNTDFTGQVNWMTTGSLALSGGPPEASFSGSVAYVSVGAPVGGHGAWSVRGALSPGEPSSWVLLGEYAAETDARHAFRAGVSYGALRPGRVDPAASTLTASVARSAGSAYMFDRWRIHRRVEVSYGLRLDAYDYVSDSPLGSSQLGIRVEVANRTWGVVEGVSLNVAPGAAEFRPPATPGLWMPPERTFSAIRQGSPLTAERVRRVVVGVDRQLGSGTVPRVLSLRRFEEHTTGQLATLFGFGPSGSAHYLTASVGNVGVDGWSLGLGGPMTAGLSGAIRYRLARVSWHRADSVGPLDDIAPSLVRGDADRLHDLSASLAADIVRTSTRLSVAYRLSTGFSLAPESSERAFGGRFEIEVRQALPYQPIDGGTFDVLVGIRNLYGELDDAGSIYDELLTMSPPIRFVGGIQVRF